MSSRSRFDRDESDRPPRSRFDRERRSRSPSSRTSDTHRTRSPVARGATDSPANAEKKAAIQEAGDRAKAAAARINALIQAKQGIQHVDVPPIRAVVAPPVPKSPNYNSGNAVVSETYQQDGDYIKDIEINDLRNRYTLTKGPTQKRIKDETGADVTTRGEYYPNKAGATAAVPPLYLHITSTTKEGLDSAVAMIEEMMKQDLPNLVDERRFRRREPENFERDELGRRKWPEYKLPVDLEPINGFNLRAQVVGRGGDNVKFIQQETSCKVQIKGRGSGFVESQTGQESDEPMFLHIAGPRQEGVDHGKKLCEELLVKVRRDYHEHKEAVAQGRFPGGGDRYQGGRPGYGDRDRSQSYGHGGYGGGYDQNSYQDYAAAGGTNGAGQSQDAHAQWQAYFAQQQAAGQDPYAPYGGYEAYAKLMSDYYSAATSQQGGQYAAASTGAPAPPAEPAPPGSAPPPPPPPPPSGSPTGGYHSVPPPPGL